MRTFLLTLTVILAAGCAQSVMQTAEERQRGICQAQGKVAVAQPNINGHYYFRCMEARHDR